MRGNEKLLVVENLTKIFTLGGRFLGSKLIAVDKANFEIKQEHPEILALVGESGSGKTTLAKMLLRVIEPTYGRVLFKGKDITQIRKRKKKLWFMKEMQPVFQNPYETFNPLKKVDSYIYESAMNYDVADSKKAAQATTNEALTSVGLSLEDIREKFPHELSGGQLQRASVARALVSNPSLLIADEPTSMIDASTRISVLNLFKRLKEDYALNIIYITHDLAVAYYLSDRIAVMLRGNIIEEGSTKKVLSDPLHPYTRILLESVPRLHETEKYKRPIRLSTIEVKEFGKLGCKFSDRCPDSLDICQRVEPQAIAIDDRIVKCHLFSPSEKIRESFAKIT